MRIENTEFVTPLEEILSELRQQLIANNIPLLQKEPRESGNNYQVQCVYHSNGQERKPSAGIKRTDGTYHCFSCGETHGLPEVISYCFGKNDFGAFGWEWLRKNFLTIEEENRGVKLNFTREHKEAQQDIKTEYVSEEELEQYRYIHPYLAERGITDEDIIDLFDLGYDKSTQSITFPVRDIEGNCLFVARRNVKTKFFNYPSGVTKPLYGLYELMIWSNAADIKDHNMNPTEGIYVCESMIDCIRLWQTGHFAVALNGLGNKLCFQQLKDLHCRTLVLATDNDKAGQEARQRIRASIKNKVIKEVIWPSNRKDAGECTDEELKNLEIVL